MQNWHSCEQVGSGQRWHHGTGLWGSLDDQSKVLCAAKNFAVSPMGGGVLFWIGAVLASILSKLWSHHPITALGSESHTGNAVGHSYAEQSETHTALHTHELQELHFAASRNGVRAACTQCEHVYQSRSVRTRLGACMPALMGTRGRVPHLLAEEDMGHRLALSTHSGALGEMHWWSSQCGCWPLLGHQLPAVFPIEAHGGRCCGVIYLFAAAPSGEGHPASMHFRGCHWQPQPTCTSSESVELHAAKTRLGMGSPEQQSAQKCPDHGQAVSPWLLDQGLAVIAQALASARDVDAVPGAPRGCSFWGFHSPTPCDCAIVESGWHLDQVQAAVCLVPAHFSPASHSGLFGDGGMDEHHHRAPSQPPSLGCCTALVWHMWSGICREPSFAVGVFLILCMPCHAVPYHARLC